MYKYITMYKTARGVDIIGFLYIQKKKNFNSVNLSYTKIDNIKYKIDNKLDLLSYYFL